MRKPTVTPMRHLVSVLLTAITVAGLVFFAGAARADRYDGFHQAGLSPSQNASVQGVVLPASVARVAMVPGSGGAEAWAAGRSISQIDGWSGDPEGQVVFLHYTSGVWRIAGPPEPRVIQGNAYNPALSDISIASNGDGWAVGEGGTILHKPPGSETWSRDASASGATNALLQGVSVLVDGGRTVGYAVGKPGTDPTTGAPTATILRYTAESGWSAESQTTEMVADSIPGFISVATVSADEAWLVSDNDSNGVKVYHRFGGAWHKVTMPSLFEGSPGGPPFPVPGPNGAGYNRNARGSAIAATASTVWVGGAMRPSDAASTASNDEEADDSRPFMIGISLNNSNVSGVTSYCPDQYRLRQGGTVGEALPSTTSLCDRPFPTTAFDIPSISMLSDTEAFAGGLGLFHFKSGQWFREPNADGYVSSVSMANPHEGWTTSGGSTYGRGSLMRAISSLAGHFTTTPIKPSLARWSQNQSEVLEAVATSPDGSQGIAVGQLGHAVIFNRQLGWDTGPYPDVFDGFHAAAWPGQYPWVVGDNGDIRQLINGNWVTDPASGVVTRRNLFGLAFRSANDGVAVGADGAIVRYNGTRWSLDQRLTDKTLFAVTATKDGYVAVGELGTTLQFSGGQWRSHPEVAGILTRSSPEAAHLYAATTGPSGKVYIGGASSALLVASGGNFSAMNPPLDGTVLAMASARAPDGSDRVFASVSPDSRKYNGQTPSVMRGTVLMLAGNVWKDIWAVRRATASPATDSSSFDDPVLGFSIREGSAGWAVGGTSAGLQIEQHLRSQPSSSVYKVDVNADPTPPFSAADVSLPSSGVNFAVFGESWCGSGLCGASAGTGTMADEVALRIRSEINKAAALTNGPKFVLFTGNMRHSGLPEELAQFREYLTGFKIPVYAAIGDKDLFSGLNPAEVTGGSSGNLTGGASSNEYWKRAFADRPSPWGSAAPPRQIHPIGPDVTGARTHYAFDYTQDGVTALRVIVLDSSSRSLGADQNPQEANGQLGWFNQMSAQSPLSRRFPIVVVMNQPTQIPDSFQTPNWTSGLGPTDAASFVTTAGANGISAVFTGGPRMNTTDLLPRSGVVHVPEFIAGGGGAPLGFERVAQSQDFDAPTKLPNDGFYHAWHLVNVENDPSAANLIGQFPTTLKTFAALDSLAMHSFDGDSVGAGNTMRFSAFGRQLSGGWSDPYQSIATYITMGTGNGVPCRSQYGQGGIYCLSQNAIRPPFRFYTDDISTAAFVLPDFARGSVVPAIIPRLGGLQYDPDGQFGLLCAFKPGRVGVYIESGFIRRKIQIAIGSGTGPCINKVFPPDLVQQRPGIFVQQPQVPQLQQVGRPLLHPPPPIETLPIVLPPAPAPIVAPAPPISAAGAQKREEKHEFQMEGQEDDNQFSAMRHTARARNAENGTLLLVMLTAGLVGMLGASVAASVSMRRRQEKYVFMRIQ